MAGSPRLPSIPNDENLAVRDSSFDLEFGGLNTVIDNSAATPTTNNIVTPPPKATAAPKGNNSTNLFTGLCEALNTWQQELVKSKTYEKADVYEIRFVPETLAAAELKKPGSTDFDKTPMQQSQTAQAQLDPATNSVDVRGRTVSVYQGTQIIQFIDQVIRGSTYISEQQVWQNDENTQTPEKNPSGTDRPTAWYKISVAVQDLGVDSLRNDHAYKMTYLVTPYGINESRSQYFPQTKFRGVHKSYNYWFTGQNIEVLSYNQKLNNLYFQTVSENLPLQRTSETNSKILYKRSWQTRSDQSDQYASGNANEPAANLADFLYTQADFATIDLRIVGDPAWLQQGETSGGLSAGNFSFSAFNNDGGINFEAQEVCFDVTFNQPEDYNLDTGLMEVNSNFKNQDGSTGRNYPSQTQTYKAIKVKSTFKGGRFEQELSGTLLTDILKPTTTVAADGRPSSSTVQDGGVSGSRNNTNIASADPQWIDVDGLQVLRSDVETDGETRFNEQNAETQPLQLSGPTSDADITSEPELLNTLPVADINSTVTQNGNRET